MTTNTDPIHLVPNATYTSREEAFKVAGEAGLTVYGRGAKAKRVVAVGEAGVFYLGGAAETSTWDPMTPVA